jgi:inosine-uridine nucleoside N-ribohydrolase
MTLTPWDDFLTGVLGFSEQQQQVETVDVELTGTLTRGMTIADWSGRGGRKPNAQIGVALTRPHSSSGSSSASARSLVRLREN